MILYIVKQGDTLSSIASQYSVNPNTIALNNGVINGRIAVGQALIIVKPVTTHVVKQGETLDSIAGQYGVSINELYRNNVILRGDSNISPGLTLIITIEKEPIGSYMTGGYAYPFIDINLLNTTLPFMGGIMPFTYGFKADGSLVMLDDNVMIGRAWTYETKPVMHLSTLTAEGVFSVELAQLLLNNRNLWDTLINNVLSVVEQKGYYGLDVDFEFLGKENATQYVQFITYVREKLNAQGYPVLVAVAPKTSVTQPGVLYEGHDYKALGEAANSVLLMTYEWGYTYGPPMAISPINQVSNVVEFALTQIDASKIFLGISNYGYDFTLPYVKGESRAPSLSYIEAMTLATDNGSVIQFDEVTQAPFFRYFDNDIEHNVWFEDARSLQARLNLLQKYNLKGALYWNLNRPNPQSLTLINSIINLSPLNLF